MLLNLLNTYTVSMYVQGNFFQNIGSITLFAVIGTAISAFIVGGGIYFLGQVRIVVVCANISAAARACSEAEFELVYMSAFEYLQFHFESLAC